MNKLSFRHVMTSIGAATMVLAACSCASNAHAAAISQSDRLSASSSTPQAPEQRIPPAATDQSPGYYGALYEWRQSSQAAAANMGAFWILAATDLRAGMAWDSKAAAKNGRSSYRVAIRDLRQLASFPDTDDTPKQDREIKADIMSLNKFFRTHQSS